MPEIPPQISSTLFRSFDFQIGSLQLSTNVLQAGLVVILLFLLVLTIAQMRRRFVDWHISGAMGGVAFGFVLAILIEGLLIVGGRTVITELVGWKSAPKPIANALDAGRSKLVNVLGVTEEVPISNAGDKPSVSGVMQSYDGLTNSEKKSLESLICQ